MPLVRPLLQWKMGLEQPHETAQWGETVQVRVAILPLRLPQPVSHEGPLQDTHWWDTELATVTANSLHYSFINMLAENLKCKIHYIWFYRKPLFVWVWDKGIFIKNNSYLVQTKYTFSWRYSYRLFHQIKFIWTVKISHWLWIFTALVGKIFTSFWPIIAATCPSVLIFNIHRKWKSEFLAILQALLDG